LLGPAIDLASVEARDCLLLLVLRSNATVVANNEVHTVVFADLLDKWKAQLVLFGAAV
jgi:hypothetical protein